MTQVQGWILIGVIAFCGGWFIKADMDTWPTPYQSALDEHERQLRAVREAYRKGELR